MFGITVLGSGSKGNSLVIHGKDNSLLLDAGFSFKELRQRFEQAGVDSSSCCAMLLSHEHTDHMKGVRVTAQNLEVPIYCNRGTGSYLKEREPKLPKLNLFSAGSEFRIEEFRVQPFSTPHDAVEPVGFTIETDTHRVGVVTDVGHPTETVKHHLRSCDGLIIESNHDIGLLRQADRPWSLKQRIISRHGHLSNEGCIDVLEEVIHPRTQYVCLVHVSGDCNRTDLVSQKLEGSLQNSERTDVKGTVAYQDSVLPTFWFEG